MSALPLAAGRVAKPQAAPRAPSKPFHIMGGPSLPPVHPHKENFHASFDDEPAAARGLWPVRS